MTSWRHGVETNMKRSGRCEPVLSRLATTESKEMIPLLILQGKELEVERGEVTRADRADHGRMNYKDTEP